MSKEMNKKEKIKFLEEAQMLNSIKRAIRDARTFLRPHCPMVEAVEHIRQVMEKILEESQEPETCETQFPKEPEH